MRRFQQQVMIVKIPIILTFLAGFVELRQTLNSYTFKTEIS